MCGCFFSDTATPERDTYLHTLSLTDALPIYRLAAVPAVRADVAIIHAQAAERQGNILIEGIIGVQKEAVLAAKRAIVTVEAVVDGLAAHPNACVLPYWTIDAIAVVPSGARPSYVHGR